MFFTAQDYRKLYWILILPLLALLVVTTSLQAQALTVITTDNADQLQPIISQPTARVNALLFSADGESLFVISEGVLLPTIWSIVTDRLTEQSGFFTESAYPGTSGGRFLHQLRLSDNGQRLMAIGSESMIWDVETGALVGVITHNASSGDITDNGIAYTGDLNGLLAGWVTAAGLVPDTSATALPDGFMFDPYASLHSATILGESIEQVEYIQDIGQIFALTASGRLYRLTPGVSEPIEVRSERMPAPLLHAGTGDGLSLTHLAVDRVRGRAAFTDSNNPPNLYRYDFQSGQYAGTRALEAPVSCLAYSPDSRIILVGDKSLPTSSLHVLEGNTGGAIYRIATQERITACASSPDGTMIAIGSYSGITLWALP